MTLRASLNDVLAANWRRRRRSGSDRSVCVRFDTIIPPLILKLMNKPYFVVTVLVLARIADALLLRGSRYSDVSVQLGTILPHEDWMMVGLLPRHAVADRRVNSSMIGR